MSLLWRLLDSRGAFMALLGIYFLLQLTLRLALPDSLDLDEAEQVFQSQWWLLGYGPQPPLYNWLQQGFFALFGQSILALSLLKNGLLMTTWALVYLIGERVLGSRRQAAIATLSLVFIPQISWESQRDLTHSVLVTTLSVATIWQGLRLLERPQLLRFLVFGLLVGLGVNAKYSYLLFFTAVALAALSLPEVRKRLLRRELAAAALVALVVVLPHWWWLAGHLDLASESTLSKLMRGGTGGLILSRLGGIVSLLNASLQFLALFLLLFAGFFWRSGRLRPERDEGQLPLQLLYRYGLSLFAVFIALILVTGVDFIKDRWMQPLLVLTPVLAFSLLRPADESGFPGYAATALSFLLLIPLFLGMRVVAVDLTGRPERLNLPYAALAGEVLARETPAVLIADQVRTAGNLHYQWPEARVLAAERTDLGDWSIAVDEGLWMIWNATDMSVLPAGLETALNRLEPAMRIEGLRYVNLPYHYSSDQGATFGIARLRPDGY